MHNMSTTQELFNELHNLVYYRDLNANFMNFAHKVCIDNEQGTSDRYNLVDHDIVGNFEETTHKIVKKYKDNISQDDLYAFLLEHKLFYSFNKLFFKQINTKTSDDMLKLITTENGFEFIKEFFLESSEENDLTDMFEMYIQNVDSDLIESLLLAVPSNDALVHLMAVFSSREDCCCVMRYPLSMFSSHSYKSMLIEEDKRNELKLIWYNLFNTNKKYFDRLLEQSTNEVNEEDFIHSWLEDYKETGVKSFVEMYIEVVCKISDHDYTADMLPSLYTPSSYREILKDCKSDILTPESVIEYFDKHNMNYAIDKYVNYIAHDYLKFISDDKSDVIYYRITERLTKCLDYVLANCSSETYKMLFEGLNRTYLRYSIADKCKNDFKIESL